MPLCLNKVYYYIILYYYTKFYRPLDTDITSDIQTLVEFFIKRLHKDGFIDHKTKEFLIQTDPKPGRFYILPKIHKHGNPGRPIVSSNGHPTERISQFVDYYLKPLVHNTTSFIKDTTHFLNKLDQLGLLPSNAILVTLDVSSLYTNIPHNFTTRVLMLVDIISIPVSSLPPPYALRLSATSSG